MNFEFATANRIVFGQGAARDLPFLAASTGRRPCIVTGNNPQRHAHLFHDLRSHNLHSTTFTIEGEPTTQTIRAGIGVARRHRSDLVIAIGGGSVIDAAKVIAALLTNTGDLFDYLEIIGQAKPLQKSSAPCIAVPTTAGTGAEVTRNSVIASPDHQVKVSMRSPFMLPSVALVDPELTLSMPPPLTASTGLDALTQLIEAFVSKKANPLTDGRYGVTQ